MIKKLSTKDTLPKPKVKMDKPKPFSVKIVPEVYTYLHNIKARREAAP